MRMKVSVDGGETFCEAHEGVIVHYEDLDLPGEDEKGFLQVNCTHEGLILDVWGDNDAGNLGTSSEMADDIVARLIEENS